MKKLDRGEAEAIVLAEEVSSPDFLLVDDSAARVVAIRRGLPIVGLIGVLVQAKKKGFLQSLTKVIGELENEAGFRIAADLKKSVLSAAGELDQ